MRKYFMAGVATAALMFGVSQAMAQSSSTDKAGASGATSAPSMSGGASMDHSKQEGSKTVGQARDESKSAQPSSKMSGDQKVEKKDMKPDQKMGAGSADQTRQNAQGDEKSKAKTTTGQARDQMKTEKGAESPSTGKMGAQPNATQNSAQAPSSSSSTKTGQQPSTMQNNAQGSSSGSSSTTTTTGSASSSATQLTTEQRTEVREKVLVNAPRETSVNFSINVGTVVPRTTHVAVVPETLIRIHPEWRSHKFFVVRDEIIIVDSDFRIIAVLPV